MAEVYNNPTPQFGTAEYAGKAGNDHCQYCHQPIAASYYRANDAMACPGCAEQLRGALAKDTHSAYVRALVYGIGAAIGGLALYATFAIVTGLVIGYASLAVGWMVGKAMIKGSNGIGGRRYQITAVLLTYAAVSMAAIPIWIHYASEHKPPQRSHPAQTQPSPEQQQLAAEQRQLESESGQQTQQQTSQPAPQPARTPANLVAWLVRVTFLGLASPFLEVWEGGPTFGWAIGLVILWVGMRFAWRLTAGKPMEIFGPFENSTQPAL